MTFNDQLLHAIGEWSKDPIEDELVFVKFREQIVNRMSTVDAFEAIGETVDVLLGQSDESNAIEVAQTLIALARRSDTTEIPARLLEQKMAIVSHFSKFGDYAKNKQQELFDYYRL
jgi:rhamnose utilization protein RhaD (predicted bifunctional aldolase and dehydrogenase)